MIAAITAKMFSNRCDHMKLLSENQKLQNEIERKKPIEHSYLVCWITCKLNQD